MIMEKQENKKETRHEFRTMTVLVVLFGIGAIVAFGSFMMAGMVLMSK